MRIAKIKAASKKKQMNNKEINKMCLQIAQNRIDPRHINKFVDLACRM